MLSSLTAHYPTLIVTFTIILSLCGCADETILHPVDADTTPTAPNYFPLTMGNRWVYRNSDGTEWSREVVQTQNIGPDSYHSFSYNPPIDDNNFGYFETLTYASTRGSVFLLLNNDNTNEVIWHTILQSGGESPDWSRSTSHNGWLGPGWQTDKRTDDILAFLYTYQIEAVSQSRTTLMLFPADPHAKWTGTRITLRGHDNNAPFSHTHTIEAKLQVLAHASYAGLVQTPLKSFSDCVKIQYTIEPPKVITQLYEPGKAQKLLSKQENIEHMRHLEDEIRKELTPLLEKIIPLLNMQTMWLARGVGPVKIETPNGIAELIDYEIKPVE